MPLGAAQNFQKEKVNNYGNNQRVLRVFPSGS